MSLIAETDRSRGRALIVDDEIDQAELMKMALSRQGVDAVAITSALEACERIAHEDFDVVLTDLGMSEMSGLELTQRLLAARPELLVVVVTGQGSSESLVAAMGLGAFDFLVKPIDAKLLGLIVARAIKHRRLQDEVKLLRRATNSDGWGPLVGDCVAIRLLRDLMERLSTSEPSVLIQGEAGTGKELVARILHRSGTRAQQPFVQLNCAALPPALIESELFGGAPASTRACLLAQAASGTLFLDEIGDIPLEIQPRLLGALQERSVRPVGADADVPFDARVIAATRRDLASEVQQKRFHEALYHCINTISIKLPPLRERGNDVLLLAQFFLDGCALKSHRPPHVISPEVAAKLLAYNWPGNVRELENSIAHMFAVAGLEAISVGDLPEEIRAYRSELFVIAANKTSEVLPLRELERRYVESVVRLVEGNKTRAAELLGLDRRTLRRKLELYQPTRGRS